MTRRRAGPVGSLQAEETTTVTMGVYAERKKGHGGDDNGGDDNDGNDNTGGTGDEEQHPDGDTGDADGGDGGDGSSSSSSSDDDAADEAQPGPSNRAARPREGGIEFLADAGLHTVEVKRKTPSLGLSGHMRLGGDEGPLGDAQGIDVDQHGNLWVRCSTMAEAAKMLGFRALLPMSPRKRHLIFRGNNTALKGKDLDKVQAATRPRAKKPRRA